MLIDELITYLFDGRPHFLVEEMSRWLTTSRRFTTFASTFRDKIRKKLRVTQDHETLYDLRLELETAYLLLQERTLNVAYEPEQSGAGRSPDFAVSFTTSMTFMLEVTRLRGIPTGAMLSEGDRLADVICSKLRQFLPQRSNILIVGVDKLFLTQSDLQAVMQRLQQRAERNLDPAFWQRYGFRDRAGFFQHYHRFSEILLRESQWRADQPVIVWVNSQTKHPLPARVRTAFYRSHGVKS